MLWIRHWQKSKSNLANLVDFRGIISRRFSQISQIKIFAKPRRRKKCVVKLCALLKAKRLSVLTYDGLKKICGLCAKLCYLCVKTKNAEGVSPCDTHPPAWIQEAFLLEACFPGAWQENRHDVHADADPVAAMAVDHFCF